MPTKNTTTEPDTPVVTNLGRIVLEILTANPDADVTISRFNNELTVVNQGTGDIRTLPL